MTPGRNRLDQIVRGLDGVPTEPPLTCPHIDKIVAMGCLPQAAIDELSEIRAINSQLRYGTWFLKARSEDAESRVRDLEERLATANALVTCCCGSPVDTHGMGDGHSPVDMYHYDRMQREARIADLEERLATATQALERQGDNMAFIINHATLPDQWLDKFSRELDEDRATLSQIRSEK